MSIHSSLRGISTLVGERSVLTRSERLQILVKKGKLDTKTGSAYRMPKVRTKFKIAGAKKAPKAAAAAGATPRSRRSGRRCEARSRAGEGSRSEEEVIRSAHRRRFRSLPLVSAPDSNHGRLEALADQSLSPRHGGLRLVSGRRAFRRRTAGLRAPARMPAALRVV